MRTVVIRITEPIKGKPYPLELLLHESPDPSAQINPKLIARATIPVALTPDSPVLDENGVPLTADRVHALWDAISGASDDMGRIGEFLYRVIARGKVKKEWDDIRAAARAGSDPTRTILDIAQSAKLATLHALPWESMYDPDTAEYLFLTAPHPMVRGNTKHRDRDDDWPLRVVVVLGAEPEQPDAGGAIGANAELRALEKLFAASPFDVEYELLEYPNPDDIIGACQNICPHVFHFIGHGEGGAGAASHKLLIYRPDEDTFEPWTLQDIKLALKGHAPRVVFLNACRTADAERGNVQHPSISSLADAFLSMGSLAVIGMQGDVPGDLAAQFSREFYEQVIDQQPLDTAILNARLKISRGRPDVARRREWSLPVAQSAFVPGAALPRRPFNPIVSAEKFVDRVVQRRKVHEAARVRAAADQASASPHLIVISGDEKTGKTHLAKWCDWLFQWRGHRTAYVSIDSPIDVLDTIRWIRDGQRPKAGQPCERVADWPLPATAFRQLNWDINHRQQGLTILPTPPQNGAEIVDQGVPLASSKNPPETFINDTLAQFRTSLEHAASERELVVFLDHIERLETATFTKWLPDYLYKPVAEGRVKGVRLVLVTQRFRDNQNLEAVLQNIRPKPTIVDVEYFEKRQFDFLARLFCLQWSEETYEDLRERVLPKILQKYGNNGRWGGPVFQSLNHACRAFNINQ